MTSPGRLPRSARVDVAALRRQLGDPHARLDTYRSTRKAAARALDSEGSLVAAQDGPVYLVTFRGHLTYRKARTPGDQDTVKGRFAFSTYAAGSGEPLDFGVFPTPPPDLPRE